jgi:hypothetical protein
MSAIRHAAALTSLAMLLASVPVAADDSPAQPDASAQFSEAARKAARGDLRGAARIFERLGAADPFWSNVFFNLAQIYEGQQDARNCALRYRRYLVLEPDAEDAASSRAAMQRCERRMGPSGRLHVTAAEPAGVPVYIDGAPVVSGASEPFALPVGRYTIRATAADYLPFEQQITVTEGQTVELAVTLVALPTFGTVSVTVTEAGAEVVVDGSGVGTTPLAEPLRLGTGRHLVEVTKEGFHKWQRRVEVFRQSDTPVEVRLLPSYVKVD